MVGAVGWGRFPGVHISSGADFRGWGADFFRGQISGGGGGGGGGGADFGGGGGGGTV